jgi:putative membrane protein
MEKLSCTRIACLAPLLATCSFVLIGCVATQAQAPPNSTLTAQDLRFLTSAYQLIDFDLQECQVVNEGIFEASTVQVANQICADAAHYKPILEQKAAAYGVTLPNSLSFDYDAEYQELDNDDSSVSVFYKGVWPSSVPSSVADRNSVYIMNQIGSHVSALAVFQDEKLHGSLPDLRELAAEVIPVAAANLERLRKVMRSSQS